MRDERRDGDRRDLPPSRRRFLQQTTGLAAASMAALATTPGGTTTRAAGMPRGPQGPPGGMPAGDPAAAAAAAADCCAAESAVPLMAAALHQGRYVGLAASAAGPGLFTLTVDKTQRVSLGVPIDVTLPPGFVVSSLGTARGQLVLSGGVPFLADSYEVDDEMSDDVRAVMEVIPEGMPTSGRRRIDVMGIQPAVLLVDPPIVEPLALPPMPARTFGVAASVAETSNGTVVVLIEHSDGRNESYYAAAVDILEAPPSGAWMLRASVRGLGESGPNLLALDSDEPVLGLNTARGGTLVAARSAPASAAGLPTLAGRVLALVPGSAGLTVLVADRAGARRWSVTPGDARDAASGASWIDRGAVGVDGEAIVGAVAVAGAPGQSILLGRRSARLVDEVSGMANLMEGGDRHVL